MPRRLRQPMEVTAEPPMWNMRHGVEPRRRRRRSRPARRRSGRCSRPHGGGGAHPWGRRSSPTCTGSAAGRRARSPGVRWSGSAPAAKVLRSSSGCRNRRPSSGAELAPRCAMRSCPRNSLSQKTPAAPELRRMTSTSAAPVRRVERHQQHPGQAGGVLEDRPLRPGWRRTPPRARPVRSARATPGRSARRRPAVRRRSSGAGPPGSGIPSTSATRSGTAAAASRRSAPRVSSSSGSEVSAGQ